MIEKFPTSSLFKKYEGLMLLVLALILPYEKFPFGALLK
jgi:hypothetical protein